MKQLRSNFIARCAARRRLQFYLLSVGTILFLIEAVGLAAAEDGSNRPPVPMLDELAGRWQDASDLASLPALNNTQGSAQSTRNVLGLEHLSFPPITMTGPTCALLVNGQTPELKQTRWYPYQVLQSAAVQNITNLGLETAVRLPYEGRGTLFHLVLTNNSTTPLTFELKLQLSADTVRHANWGWFIPRDANPRLAREPITDGKTWLVQDETDQLANAFSFAAPPDQLTQGASGRASWQIKLPPHAAQVINFTLAVGEQPAMVQTLAQNWATHFDAAFAQVKTDWQQRFDAMFTPHNQFFSGSLPVLKTADADLRRVYYMSAVSLLSVCRTGFPMAPRVYVSNSPEYNGIMMYFWDTGEWANTLALLDPAMLKQYLRNWLTKGIYNGYAEEYLTGTLQGPWYSANDLSIFRLLNAYLNVTLDRAFLSEKIQGKTVLDWMDAIATHWEQLVRPGQTLADYGEAQNLLECVPTYINEVPSFNAANVWMMRRVAAIQEAEGHTDRARELRAKADRLLAAVLNLYEPGQGVWDSLHRDGRRTEMRHVLDFVTIGMAIPQDLTPVMRREMTDFVEHELMTDHWMRAQSLTDPAAGESDRPDHGPMGAYCAWPAETMAVLCQFGEFHEALDFLHRCTGVTFEGPFSQSRELLGKTRDARVRIASRGLQDYNASNGGSYAETIIREFFGYQPDFLNQTLVPDKRPRAFAGELLGVLNGQQFFDIRSTKQGIEAKHE